MKNHFQISIGVLTFALCLFAPHAESHSSGGGPTCSCDAFDYYTQKSQEETARLDEKIRNAKSNRERRRLMRELAELSAKYEIKIQRAFNECQAGRFGCDPDDDKKESASSKDKDSENSPTKKNGSKSGSSSSSNSSGGGSSSGSASSSSGGGSSPSIGKSSGNMSIPIAQLGEFSNSGGGEGNAFGVGMRQNFEQLENRNNEVTRTEVYTGSYEGGGSIENSEELGFLTLEQKKKKKKKKGEEEEELQNDGTSSQGRKSAAASKPGMPAGVVYYGVPVAPNGGTATAAPSIMSLASIQKSASELSKGSSLAPENKAKTLLYDGYLNGSHVISKGKSKGDQGGLSADEIEFLSSRQQAQSRARATGGPSEPFRKIASAKQTEPLEMNSIISTAHAPAAKSSKMSATSSAGRPKWVSYLPKFVQESSLLKAIFPQREPASEAISDAAQIAGMHTDIFYNINRAYQFAGGTLEK